MKLFEPHPHVVEHEVSHGVATAPVIIDSLAPGSLVAVGQIRTKFRKVVSLGSKVVVDHVQEDGDTVPVAGVHQLLQTARPAIRILRSIRKHAVVAPVAVARKLADRHDLDRRDSQLFEIAQPRDDRLERPLARESSHVDLIEDKILAADSFPILIRPGKLIGKHNRRGAKEPVRLPERAGIGAARPSVQAVDVVLAFQDSLLDTAMIPAGLGLHRHLARSSPSINTSVTCCASGAQSRHRTSPSGPPAHPHGTRTGPVRFDHHRSPARPRPLFISVASHSPCNNCAAGASVA